MEQTPEFIKLGGVYSRGMFYKINIPNHVCIVIYRVYEYWPETTE